jgi:hypothetical protein
MPRTAPTGNTAFDAAELAAERTRQVSLATATTAAQIKAAHDTYHVAIVAAGAANGVQVPAAREYLRENAYSAGTY